MDLEQEKVCEKFINELNRLMLIKDSDIHSYILKITIIEFIEDIEKPYILELNRMLRIKLKQKIKKR